MLFSSLSDYAQSVVPADRMAKVLEFLSRDDLADIECGRHDIDGDNVFANVMEFETVPASEKPFEAHRRYADVHFVISGVERLACAPVDELEALGEYNDGDDYGLYVNPKREAWVEMHEGDLVVTPPCDAHKPGCCTEAGPAKLKKVCVKVLVD